MSCQKGDNVQVMEDHLGRLVDPAPKAIVHCVSLSLSWKESNGLLTADDLGLECGYSEL